MYKDAKAAINAIENTYTHHAKNTGRLKMCNTNRKVYVKCHRDRYEIIMFDDHGLYHIWDCESYNFAVQEAEKVAVKNNATYDGVII